MRAARRSRRGPRCTLSIRAAVCAKLRRVQHGHRQKWHHCSGRHLGKDHSISTSDRRPVPHEALAKATDDFSDRLGREVRNAINDGREYNTWDLVTRTILDYVGARSVVDPQIAKRDTWEALRSAAATAMGAVQLAYAPPQDSFTVFVSYVNSGVTYSRGPSPDKGRVSVWDWLTAFRLHAICGGDEFVVLGESTQCLPAVDETTPPNPRAAVAYARALMAYRDDDRDELARQLAATGGAEGVLAAEIAVFQALADDDQATFPARLGELLTAHRATVGPRPAELLHYGALALARLAHRRQWTVGTTSEYLPERLVTGAWLEPSGRRVGAFGADPTPMPPEGLAVPRAEFGNASPESAELYDRKTGQAIAFAREQAIFTLLGNRQHWRMSWRASADPRADDVRQWYAVALAAQAGGAAVQVESASEDESVTVALGSARFPVPGSGGHGRIMGYRTWEYSVAFARIARDADALRNLARIDVDRYLADCPRDAHRWYVRATLAHLRGADPRADIENGLAAAAKITDDIAPFVEAQVTAPLLLLSQLVVGDPEAFALCLADGLETWRDFYSRPDQADAPQQLIAVPLLGLACVAHDRGWRVAVDSEYLPARLRDGSWVGTPVLVD